jgi:hypothetical protein
MNCDKIQIQISWYIDNQLDSAEASIIEAHIKECEQCRLYYEKLLKLAEMADGFEPEGGDSYWEKQKEAVIEKISEAEADNIAPVRPKKSKDVYYRFALVAAAVAVVAFVSIYESMEIDTTEELFAPKGRVAETGKADQTAVDEPVIAESVLLDTEAEIDQPQPVVDESVEILKDVSEESEAVEKAVITDKAAPSVEPETMKKSSRRSPAPVKTEIMAEKKQVQADIIGDDEGVDVVRMRETTAERDELSGKGIIEMVPKPVTLDDKALQPLSFLNAPEAEMARDDISDIDIPLRYENVRVQAEPWKMKYFVLVESSSKKDYTGAVRVESAEPPSVNFDSMAIAFYRLGKITPDEDERSLMIEYLENIQSRADSATVASIIKYLDELRAIAD